jgi:DNA polymerase III subunit epsilon
MGMEQLPINEAEFVVLDVETTGLEPSWGHRVCEVGLVVWRERIEIDRFWALVNPDRSIDPSAALINKLTDEMLAGEPPMTAVLPQLRDLISDRVLVAYNASFDVGFLRSEYRLAGEELPEFRVLDVMAMARRLLPDLGRYPLFRVAERMGYAFEGHRAIADVMATSAVFHDFLDMLGGQGIETVEQLEEITRPTSPAAESLRREKVQLITQAIEEERRVNLLYRARDEALTEREVLPKDIQTYAGSAQLIGYCYLRDADRTFTIDSIQDVQLV